MRHIPFPTYDLQPAMKTSPERVDAIIRRMQDSLQRNSNPSQGGRSNAFRLTQGFLQSSTQQVSLSLGNENSNHMQVLDRWSAQVQDCVHNVKRDQQGEVLEEVELAEGHVREAEKCKLLLSSLHETTAQREEPTPMNRFVDIPWYVGHDQFLTILASPKYCRIFTALYFAATWQTCARACRSSSPSTWPPVSTACSPQLK